MGTLGLSVSLLQEFLGIKAGKDDRWSESSVKSIVQGVCQEMENTIDPSALHHWIMGIKDNPAELCAYVNISHWLAPHIPDDAEIGVYSKTINAQNYRNAVEQMPKLVMLATFGRSNVVHTLKEFMDQWKEADEMIADEHLGLFDNIVSQDRGPLFFWLLNCATEAQRKKWAHVLSDMHCKKHLTATMKDTLGHVHVHKKEVPQEEVNELSKPEKELPNRHPKEPPADDVVVQEPAPVCMDDMGRIKLQGDKMPLDLDEEDEEDEAEKIQPAPTEEPLLLQPSADLTLMSPSSSNNAAQVEVHVADEIAYV